MLNQKQIEVRGARENNLKNVSVKIPRNQISIVTGVSGSGKSSLAFDTILKEAQRRFFYTLSHYSRQFLDIGTKPEVIAISGLSPAIGLTQNETQPSPLASVATITDLGELLAVLFAKYGERYCPKHMEATGQFDLKKLVQNIAAAATDKTVAICAPLVEQKKGHYAEELTRYAERGFLRAIIDGQMVSLNPTPSLDKNQKHSISIVIDSVKVKEGAAERMERSITTALEEGKGFGEYYVVSSVKTGYGVEQLGRFSDKQGCPVCGFSWPNMDSRHFSKNSLGKCSTCKGVGFLKPDSEDDEDILFFETCGTCEGTGLSPQLRSIKFFDRSLLDFYNMPLVEIQSFLGNLPNSQNAGQTVVVSELRHEIEQIVRVRLGYISPLRAISTLSRGEHQRLRLSGLLNKALRGILYVMDEPSQGLHPQEVEQLWEALENLKGLGNTVILVDHDEHLIRKADNIIDMGPGGGRQGGTITACFKPAQAHTFKTLSETARHLAAEPISIERGKEKPSGKVLTIKSAHIHNLRIPKAEFCLGAINVVSGVSGAGKTNLVIRTLYRSLMARKAATRTKKVYGCGGLEGADQIENCYLVDRRHIAKSSVSMPATYLDVFTEIRNLFAQLPEAQVAGIDAKDFSLWGGNGRCEECNGKGEIQVNMRFLAEAKVHCSVCQGKRYKPHILSIKYNGYSIGDVLGLTLSEVADLFRNFSKIAKRLNPALEIGLDYLRLGQSTKSLSGGEAQRLKLASFFFKRLGVGDILFLDEPTSGLHFNDVKKLIAILKRLSAEGATIVVIEHNVDIIKNCDWLLEIGPGSAAEGGRLIFQGLPADILKQADSPSAAFLR
ncbi:MAG: hypothetical protein AB7T49_15910 [Oligoflexales bacterium]